MNFEDRMEELQEAIRAANKLQDDTEAEMKKVFHDEYPQCPVCEQDTLEAYCYPDTRKWDIFCNNSDCSLAVPDAETFHEANTYLKALVDAKNRLEAEKENGSKT